MAIERQIVVFLEVKDLAHIWEFFQCPGCNSLKTRKDMLYVGVICRTGFAYIYVRI